MSYSLKTIPWKTCKELDSLTNGFDMQQEPIHASREKKHYTQEIIYRASRVCLPLDQVWGVGVMKDKQGSGGQWCSGEQTRVGLEQCDERAHRSSQDSKGSQCNTKLPDVKSVLFSIAISPAHGLEPGT